MRTVTSWNNLTFLAIEGVLYIAVYIWHIDTPCFFETYINIPCPLCYMTAAFDYLRWGMVKEAILENILILWIVPVALILNIACVGDILTLNKYKLFNKLINRYIISYWTVAVIAAGWIYVILTH